MIEARSHPALSVVIPARDAATTIGEQLDALRGQAHLEPIEIVVVDNGSTDGTSTVVRRHAAVDPRVHVVTEVVPGAAAALNRGIAEARSDRLAFCDADDVVADGWIETALRALDDHDLVTGPLELELLNDPAIAASRGCRWASRLEFFADVFPLIPSGNFAVRREALRAIGYFDPGIRVGYDVELAYRAFQAGIRVHFEPGLSLHYRYRTDALSQWAQGRAMGRFRPGLYRRIRRDGHAVPSRLRGLRTWAWLVRATPGLRHRGARLRWVWVAANQIGHLEGSIRSRSVFL